MKKMIYYTIPLLLLVAAALVAFKSTAPKDLNKYKFLFRNDIYSLSKKDDKTNGSAYQLTPVMRGKTYRTSYMYLPDQNQYLVCSTLEPLGFRRYDAYAPPHNQEVKRHVLLDSKGQEVQRIDTDLNFSTNSGLFFTQEFYINWLPAGDTTTIPYAGIYNKDLEMDSKEFVNSFRKLFAKAEYMEFVNLRTQSSDSIDAGVVFKIKQQWHILLNGYRDSHLYGKYEENKRTGVDNYIYTVKFDYYDPDRKRINPYPQSPPLTKAIYLETEDSRPNHFNRITSHDGLKMVKYHKLSATGWQGVAEIAGIPIYVPGTGEGIAYMKYKIGKESIHFKIPDVSKTDYTPIYNLGVRSFKTPSQLKIKAPLVFIESNQNYGPAIRDGLGIYVLRPCKKAASNTTSLPKGISEKRFTQLPLKLQVALMDIEGTTQLEMKDWHAEIELLYNLEYLHITGSLKAFPDGILRLKNLEVLNIERCGVGSIPDEIAALKQLKALNISCNSLNSFPQGICQLKELTHLNIWGNDLSEIPNSIGDLTKLRKLNIAYIKVSLPEIMLGMKDLKIQSDEDFKETVPERFHFLLEE